MAQATETLQLERAFDLTITSLCLAEWENHGTSIHQNKLSIINHKPIPFYSATKSCHFDQVSLEQRVHCEC